MGNCQAAETVAPAAEIEHPDGKLDRIYWPITASQIMAANPGYYVAVVSDSNRRGEGMAAKNVRLLPPEDIIHVGRTYRLVSFEEVLMEFGSRKSVRLSRLIRRQKERDECEFRDGVADGEPNSSPEKTEEEINEKCFTLNGRRSSSMQRQWKPALQSIEEGLL